MTKLLVLDTETTGMNPDSDAIVELAGVVRDGDSLRSYDTLCRPGVPIPAEASGIHHIVDSMVDRSPTPLEAMQRLIHHLDCEDAIFVAHNAEFDRGFLDKLTPYREQRRWICTFRTAMCIWPDAPGYSNQTLRYWLNLDLDLPSGLHPHRALYDAIVTEGILQRMLAERSVENIVRISSEPVLLKKVRFGKHKGELWKDVPSGYLRWILRQDSTDRDVRHTAEYWLSN